MAASRFDALESTQIDPTFALMTSFKGDPAPEKVNLAVGAYRDSQGKPWVLDSAKEQLSTDPLDNHDYLPPPGNADFLRCARDLLFRGASYDEQWHKDSNRIASVQTISGTGANHLGARFLVDALRPKRVWVSDPTWSNHHLIWQLVGSQLDDLRPLEIRSYRYHNTSTHTLDFEGMISDLEHEAEANDVLLLHACAHNPTGLDPSSQQWEKIADICQKKALFPFFDSAYQGFASSSLENDAFPIRHFFARNLELCVAQSFSKNMGLYGERVGAFHLVTSSETAKDQSFRRLVRIQRGEISSPPAFGAKIATKILSEPTLFRQWEQDLAKMNTRLQGIRYELWKQLTLLGTPGNWDHLRTQVGMFSYIDLNGVEMELLKTKHHVYGMPSGRISMTGVTDANVVYVAKALDAR
ncbi:hypothetical protein AAEP93_000504 [Penicillium crustosum]